MENILIVLFLVMLAGSVLGAFIGFRIGYSKGIRNIEKYLNNKNDN